MAIDDNCIPVQSIDILDAIRNPLNLPRINGSLYVQPGEVGLIHDICQGGFARTVYEDYYLASLDIAVPPVTQLLLPVDDVERPVFIEFSFNDPTNTSVDLILQSPRTNAAQTFDRAVAPQATDRYIYHFNSQFVVGVGYQIGAVFTGSGAGDEVNIYCYYARTNPAC